jgi:microcystin-dependent protein
MSLSYNDYSGDGSTTDFTLSFDYLSKDHVHVVVGGVETSFTWLSDSQVRISPAPIVGVSNVRIKRVTPNDARLVDFANGSTLDAEADLDQDSNQLFYILQEAIDGTVSLSSSTDHTNIAIATDSFASGSGFTAGSTTALTLSQVPGTKDNTFVTFDGVVQHKSTYSVASNVITFTSAIPIGVSAVDVVSFPTLEFFYATLANGAVTTPKLADTAVTTAKLADASVTNAKLAAAAVGTTNLIDGSVTLAKLDPTGTSALLPLGVVLPYSGPTAPTGWLLCDGSAVSRTTYAALFALVSTTYGTGNGTTTFNLPDLRGRTPIGAGTGSGLTARTLGTALGEEAHTIDITEVPSHSHGIGTDGTSTTGTTAILRVGGAVDLTKATGVTGGAGSSSSTGAGGATVAHNNMQPSLVLNFIIKAS